MLPAIHLDELEHLALLALTHLHGKASGVTLRTKLQERMGRSITMTETSSALSVLCEHGYVSSDTPAGEGARREFEITESGIGALHCFLTSIEKSQPPDLRADEDLPGHELPRG